MVRKATRGVVTPNAERRVIARSVLERNVIRRYGNQTVNRKLLVISRPVLSFLYQLRLYGLDSTIRRHCEQMEINPLQLKLA
jgi:hypothetical protein